MVLNLPLMEELHQRTITLREGVLEIVYKFNFIKKLYD